MSTLLDLAYLAALGAASPYLAYRIALRPRHLDGLKQRLGACAPRDGDAPCIWVHGVSVGEVAAASPLVDQLLGTLPPVNGKPWDVVISTTTSSGQDIAKRRFPNRRVVYYPIDFSWSVKRVFDAVRPSLVLLVELELWPNFLKAAKARGVPVVVVNGRISEKSFRGYRIARRILPLENVALYCCQTEDYASRFRRLGVSEDRIIVTGSMKYDGVRTGGLDAQEMRQTLGLAPDELVLIAGSTHAPEERLVAATYARLKKKWPRLRLVLAPRHVERTPEVVREVEAATQEQVFRRSEQVAKPAAPLPQGIVLVDTIGELGKLYAAADLVFVGGSLIPHGGQNILEPAGLGKPGLFGPHAHNFQESVERLIRAEGAIQVRDARDLEAQLEALLRDPDRARALGQNARTAIEAAKGATARTVAAIGGLFHGRQGKLPGRPGARNTTPSGQDGREGRTPETRGEGGAPVAALAYVKEGLT